MFTNGLGCHSIKDTMHNDLPERYRVYLAYLISTYVRVSENEFSCISIICRKLCNVKLESILETFGDIS